MVRIAWDGEFGEFDVLWVLNAVLCNCYFTRMVTGSTFDINGDGNGDSCISRKRVIIFFFMAFYYCYYYCYFLFVW